MRGNLIMRGILRALKGKREHSRESRRKRRLERALKAGGRGIDGIAMIPSSGRLHQIAEGYRREETPTVPSPGQLLTRRERHHGDRQHLSPKTIGLLIPLIIFFATWPLYALSAFFLSICPFSLINIIMKR